VGKHLVHSFVIAVVLVLATASFAAAPPSTEELAKIGAQSVDRIAKNGAQWEAVITPAGGNGTTIAVSILQVPQGRRTDLAIHAPGVNQEAARVIERDGVWFVSEGNRHGKYRPHEAPFVLPTVPLFAQMAEPEVVIPDTAATLGVAESMDGNIATFRAPLDPQVRQQIQGILAQMDQFQRERPGSLSPKLAEQSAMMRDMLDHGLLRRVDVSTGVIVRTTSPKFDIEIKDFRWIDRPPGDALQPGNGPWEDFTDEPTAGDVNELVMLAHSSAWQPGQPAGDVDATLVDLRTGRYRRVPFQGALSMVGCFSKDRRRVYVSGMSPQQGSALAMYEINLKTGENRRLGDDAMARGITVMPALSPDGKTLAALHKQLGVMNILDCQVVLFDIASGAARPIGPVMDAAFLNWLPDGKGLVLLRREGPANDERTQTISRMTLDGTITPIRSGRDPLILADGKTLLFRENDRWMTCDLDGQHAQPFGNGFSDYAFPAAAPDGKRILMMRKSPNGPVPTLINLSQTSGEPALRAPGLWSMPAWR
jgi:hypothetical protein